MNEQKSRTDPLEEAVHLLGGRWKLLMIRELIGGPRRFGELRRALPGITQKVLTETLRSLEEQGIVLRTVYEEVPLRVTYSLTEAGYKLAPVLGTLSACYGESMSSVRKARRRQYYTPTPFQTRPPLEARLKEAGEALRRAEILFIGTGSGVNSGVLDFFSRSTAAQWVGHVPGAGTFTLDELIDLYCKIGKDNEGAFWAFWAPFLRTLSQVQPPVFLRSLASFAAQRQFFLITTNGDRLEERAGFPAHRIYRTAGDYGRLQCAMPCCDRTYEAADYIGEMAELARVGREIPHELIPRCPQCGGYLVPNHYRTRMVSLASEHSGRDGYLEFFKENRGKPAVFLELGCGLRFPAAIRTPFEEAVACNENAVLIRCNTKYPDTSLPPGKAVVFPEEMSRVVEGLVEIARQAG